jgi:hypothetical protein
VNRFKYMFRERRIRICWGARIRSNTRIFMNASSGSSKAVARFGGDHRQAQGQVVSKRVHGAMQFSAEATELREAKEVGREMHAMLLMEMARERRWERCERERCERCERGERCEETVS